MAKQNKEKKHAAEAALNYLRNKAVIGIGTGSTVDELIDCLPSIQSTLGAVVASSAASQQRLEKLGIRVDPANAHSHIDVYVDGADEFDPHGHLIKGGGGAMTGEKICTCLAKRFICIVDSKKAVPFIGSPVAVEVLPMARSQVARQLLAMGADPVYRPRFVTDFGNQILDVHQLDLSDPQTMSQQLKQITGVVEHGIFAGDHSPHQIIIGHATAATELSIRSDNT